jgi:hypothetical protein
MAVAFAYVGNTNVLTLTGLKSDDEDTFLNSATITVTVKDANGAAISGESWPVTMDYVAASDGDYRAVISHSAAITNGQVYTAVVDVDASDTSNERVGHWEFPFTAKVRNK